MVVDYEHFHLIYEDPHEKDKVVYLNDLYQKKIVEDN